ncbi:MAG: stage II sporulation protein M [Clostridia bacterium]|nr:stage II sporulation protein M [Clostridia bacterium]
MNIIKTRKINWKNKRRIILLEKNYNVIILTILIGFGIVIGALIFSKTTSDLNNSIDVLYDNFVSSAREKSFISNFTDTFINSMVYLFLFFIMGTNAVGIPFIYFITCIKGIGNGIISGYLYSTFGLQGVGFSTLVIFPYALISGIIVILMGDSSIKLSKNIFLSMTGKSYTESEITIKKYCINFIIYTAFFIVASMIDAIFKVSFSNTFNI